jgi:hypothetical protein
LLVEVVEHQVAEVLVDTGALFRAKILETIPPLNLNYWLPGGQHTPSP